MKIKGVIWCLKTEDGKAQLRRMIESYKYWGVNVEKECWYSMSPMVFFDNGDIWKAINASESHRGQRANLSYIHRSLLTEDNPDYLPGMIRNCTYAYPWHGYCLYG